MAATRALVVAFPLMIAAILSHACGVSFSSNFEGTELFKPTPSLSGTPAGTNAEPACARSGDVWECANVTQLTVHLGVTNGYPVPVRVACFLEDQDRTLTDDEKKMDFQDRTRKVGETVLEPQPGRRPDEKEIEVQPLDITFAAPPPGFYFIACHTPAAPDNGPFGLNVRILG